MAKALADEESTGVYPDEYVDYLEALATSGIENIFSLVKDSGEDKELLDLAMRFEREQLSLQQDLGNLHGDRHAIIINEVIAEERSHLVQLANAKKEIFGE